MCGCLLALASCRLFVVCCSLLCLGVCCVLSCDVLWRACGLPPAVCCYLLYAVIGSGLR